MKRITTKALADSFIDEQIKAVREQVGDKKVLLALSVFPVDFLRKIIWRAAAGKRGY